MFEEDNDRENDLDNFEPVAKIVVIGVGGAGNNAVNRMIDDNIQNVDFYVCNTDMQALASSKATNRIVLGESITKGLGAGGDPAVGKQAAEASADEIRSIVEGADMVFIAAGMGKGTGTGAAPVVAKIAKDAGCLTLAIVTRPFGFEGQKRTENSIQGLTALRDVVDSVIIVSNDRLLSSNGDAPVNKAFQESDRVLAQSVRTVADLILVPAMINLDFADVKSTLKNSGVALIGYGVGKGEHRAEDAAESALNSPLLEASISGARRAICFVTCGSNVTLYEAQRCVAIINEQSGGTIDIKFGVSINPNPNLEDCLLLSVIATDFEDEVDFASAPKYKAPTSLGEIRSSREAKENAANKEGNGDDGIISDFLPNFLNEDSDE